jgi:hypothetical protein
MVGKKGVGVSEDYERNRSVYVSRELHPVWLKASREAESKGQGMGTYLLELARDYYANGSERP